MTRLTREAWLRAGFEALDRHGHGAVSAQALARRLNVTRGSFYHHFSNRGEFVQSLLQRWEHDYTLAVLAEARVTAQPMARLQRYVAVAAGLQPGREVAIRAWAAKDVQVQAALRRVDALRQAFAHEMAHALLPRGTADADVETVAQLAYLGFIGLQQAGPLDPQRFVRFFADLMRLGARLSSAPTAGAPA